MLLVGVCLGARDAGSLGHQLDPGVEPRLGALGAGAHQACDVAGGPGGEHEAERWGDPPTQAPPPQDEMDERTTRPAVAVGEGVKRLELRVGEGGLYERRVVVAGEVGAEVVEQGGQGRVGWGHEGRIQRGVAADPVLLRADHTAQVGVPGVGEQRAVDVAQGVRGDRAVVNGEGGRHRPQVADDLLGRAGGIEGGVEVGEGEAARADHEALDERGADGFRAQQQACEHLQAVRPVVVVGGRVQHRHRALRVGDVGSDLGVEGELQSHERIGHKRVVGAARAGPARAQAVRIGLPALRDEPAHGAPLSAG